MISIYEGKVGGGKTYSAVKEIAAYLAAGGTVLTNIALSHEGLTRRLSRKFGVIHEPSSVRILEGDDEIYQWYEFCPWGTVDCPTLVVIDEAQLFYNARDWKRTEQGHRPMLSFLAQSRKACVDIIFVTQSAASIDRQFRDQAQFIFRYRDMSKLPMPILTDVLLLLGWRGMKATIDHTGATLKWEMVQWERSVFACYDTLAMLNDEMAARAKKARAAAVVRRRVTKIPLGQRILNAIIP